MVLMRRYLILALATLILLTIALVMGLRSQRKLPSSSIVMQVVVDTTLLREGDLLLRMGEGWQSRMVAHLSGEEYSHIALAHHGPKGWMAVHAVPDEIEPGEQHEYLKAEPLSQYYATHRAVGGAIARIDCSEAYANRAVQYALDKVQRRFEFDHQYSLSDSTQYYCTELVYRAYLSQGIDFFPDFVDTAAKPQSNETWLYPNAFLRHPRVAWYKVLDIRPATKQ